MSIPIFQLVTASPEAVALLGANPTRFYPFGEADQRTLKPYAVWQQVSGEPLNKLAGVPDHDAYAVQVDVYADTGAVAREVAMALRDALEPDGYISSWNGESREPDTRLFRFSFAVEFMMARSLTS
jgi:hypothetical protein